MSSAWWKLVHFGFRLLYNEFAFTYDLVSTVVSLGAWRCWQRAALKHLNVTPGARVLEIAYGTGDLQLDLSGAGYKVVGHDLSLYMASIAQAKLRRQGLAVRLTRGQAQRLPYASQIFAAVVSTFPADFIFADETLREVERVLLPGGRFVIVPNGVLTAQSPAASGLEWLYRVTGQRSDAIQEANLATYLARYGFEARLMHETCPRSVAIVIVARKGMSENATVDMH